MNITMEMIEQVIDATGADYYAVKQALTENNCNVEEAIRVLKEKAENSQTEAEAEAEAAREKAEEAGGAQDADKKEEGEGSSSENTDGNQSADDNPFEEVFSDEYAEKMVDRLKKKVQSGNVDRIRITKDGKTILDIPVPVGIVGGLIGFMAIPWAMILGIITMYGLNCKVEIVSEDGKSEQL